MASPSSVSPGDGVTAPPADARAVRASLTPTLAAEFDREWRLVLDQAKQAMDLGPVQDLIAKWRHIAYGEMVDPGSYYRTLAKAEHIMRSGEHPGAVSGTDMNAMIRERLGRQVYRIVPDDSTMQQVAELPVAALESFAEVLSVLS